MTTNFILAPGEEFIQCPYNTAHQITNARFLTHLDKCRKVYLKDLTSEGRQKCIKICRHNAMHHVPAPELRFHESRCIDAFPVVRQMAYHSSVLTNESHQKYGESQRQDHDWKEVNRRSHSHASRSSSRRHSSSTNIKYGTNPGLHKNERGLEEEEDWESESKEAGYDPEKKLKSEFVMYNPSGLTKSERKKFRNEVRQKATEMILKGDSVQLPTTSSFDVMPNITNLKIKQEEDRSSQEAGLIDEGDDDSYHNDDFGYKSNDHRRHYEDRHSYRDSRDCFHSSSSSQSHYSSRHPQPTYLKSDVTIWNDQMERASEEDYPDSDDFEGIDPYKKFKAYKT